MTGPDPRARGFLGAWVSRALLWSATTRTLLGADGLGEKYLAFVAFYLCLKDACLLVDGSPSGDIPRDPVARADCPMDLDELRKLRDRAAWLRHEILHLSDKRDDGRALEMTWTIERPYPVFRSSVGRDTLAFDEMSKPDVGAILDKLDPWLRRHWDRLVHEDDDAEGGDERETTSEER